MNCFSWRRIFAARVGRVIGDLAAMRTLPKVSINLMCGRLRGQDPFYERLTLEFEKSARKHHRRLPFIGTLTHGVALCVLPEGEDAYLRLIEASGRRNTKKAQRNGYTFSKIDFNEHLTDIAEIRGSAEVRQGRMPAEFLRGDVRRCENPRPKTRTHDYPYFGVLKNGKLVAYAGVLVAGELAMIEHIYGHAKYQSDGVVPFLFIGIAGYLKEHYPSVKYYGYGSYFGASESMRRFKRKFNFLPHRVKWVLGA